MSSASATLPTNAANPEPPASRCTREESERLVVVGACCIASAVRGGVAGLPAAGWELSQASPPFSPRRRRRLHLSRHHALPWSEADCKGHACHAVPVPEEARGEHLLIRDLSLIARLAVARCGTGLAGDLNRIPAAERPRSPEQGALVPPSCHAERPFLFIAVLLCPLRECTREARIRRIPRIRASHRPFRAGVRIGRSEVPVLVGKHVISRSLRLRRPAVPPACHSYQKACCTRRNGS